MKKYMTAFLSVLFLLNASAAGFYDQLCAFNPNWKSYLSQAPAGEARKFASDREYIQAHLEQVLAVLRTNPTVQLNNAQLASRTHLINLLDGYRIAGQFPRNYYRNERIPVFIDEHATHCAVGYLMQQTGHEAMAQRIAAADNYVWVKDLHDAEVPAWQQASGFSMEELKLIQGAYDSYMENAFFLPNKYEIPQKPDCIVAYFDNTKDKKPENIWCSGEGKHGVLNGRWEQNYAVGIPWIIGYYENGQRTGKWAEYYQGTKLLCRTEHWKDNKLNGVRTRFDRAGKVIEEIIFKNGKAITKINYSLSDSLCWVRTPLDSLNVWTEVFNGKGVRIASGHETVYNPGNLQWFQNIELTALNTVALSAKSANEASNGNISQFGNGMQQISLYNQPQLVQYKKQGDWMYYQEHTSDFSRFRQSTIGEEQQKLHGQFPHFGQELAFATMVFGRLAEQSGYDSIRAVYADNNLQHFYGYSKTNYLHLFMDYHHPEPEQVSLLDHRSMRFTRYAYVIGTPSAFVKTFGQYNEAGQKTGEWKYFDREQRLYKIETFILPHDEEEDDKLSIRH